MYAPRSRASSPGAPFPISFERFMTETHQYDTIGRGRGGASSRSTILGTTGRCVTRSPTASADTRAVNRATSTLHLAGVAAVLVILLEHADLPAITGLNTVRGAALLG